MFLPITLSSNDLIYSIWKRLGPGEGHTGLTASQEQLRAWRPRSQESPSTQCKNLQELGARLRKIFYPRGSQSACSPSARSEQRVRGGGFRVHVWLWNRTEWTSQLVAGKLRLQRSESRSTFALVCRRNLFIFTKYWDQICKEVSGHGSGIWWLTATAAASCSDDCHDKPQKDHHKSCTRNTSFNMRKGSKL